ncbi:hypothetical protein IW262DRAFT_926232 [Armillaria fumosa]|nr:hypothetical protein IW262DRAFT_926232 [Armillaria fumosa]
MCYHMRTSLHDLRTQMSRLPQERRSMLSKVEKRIALLEHHIQQIDEMTECQRAVRDSMAEECQRTRDLVRVGRAPLSAIRRLPAEVITEISRHTIEMTPPKGWVSGATNESIHWEFQHRESIELVSMRRRDALLSHRKPWSNNIIIRDVSIFWSFICERGHRSFPGPRAERMAGKQKHRYFCPTTSLFHSAPIIAPKRSSSTPRRVRSSIQSHIQY